jgi:hypothetical protein
MGTGFKPSPCAPVGGHSCSARCSATSFPERLSPALAASCCPVLESCLSAREALDVFSYPEAVRVLGGGLWSLRLPAESLTLPVLDLACAIPVDAQDRAVLTYRTAPGLPSLSTEHVFDCVMGRASKHIVLAADHVLRSYMVLQPTNEWCLPLVRIWLAIVTRWAGGPAVKSLRLDVAAIVTEVDDDVCAVSVRRGETEHQYKLSVLIRRMTTASSWCDVFVETERVSGMVFGDSRRESTRVCSVHEPVSRACPDEADRMVAELEVMGDCWGMSDDSDLG